MDTRLLEDALLLLEENSLTAAAERRRLTQPAFSRRIRSLEQWLGRDLLTRGPNRVEVSPVLKDSEPMIRALLAQMQQLRRHLREPEDRGKSLIVVTQHSLSVFAVPEIVIKPGASTNEERSSVRLRTHNQHEALSLFLRHEADILISYEFKGSLRMPFDDTVVRHVWRRDAMVPVVGGCLRDSCDQQKTLPGLTPRISYPTESFFGQIVDQQQQRAEIKLDGPVAVETAFSVGVVKLVLSGVGAAWVPQSLVQDNIISGDVTILSSAYGRVPALIVLYAHATNAKAQEFLRRFAEK